MTAITPYLWFANDDGLAAATFYAEVLPNCRVVRDDGLTVEFELDGRTYVALNGGPHFRLNEAFSLMITCEDQAEVDHYWSRLLEGGGEESQCGWLKDRFGVSWQVTPTALLEALSDPDPERAERARQAMFTMRKIDIAAIEEARNA
ncbi:MAG TPA: VOC family protein [Mycobacteriales bacterium]|nr:VOC family protein [Mycobacteriales bacterium]